MSYERISIGGEPYLIGNPPLEKSLCLGLNVGDRVVQVGLPARSGKQTSSARVDKFKPWVEYAGCYRHELTVYLAFRLAPGAVMERNKKEVPGDFYRLYILIYGGFLCVPNQDNLTSRLYSGDFVSYQQEEIA